MEERLREVLKKIARALNEGKISYGIGASVMLYHHGIGRSPRDIDIQVDVRDIERVDEILSLYGRRGERFPDEIYKTRYFYEYEIDGVEVDVMGGLCVRCNGEDHAFDFHKDMIEEIVEVDGVEVPLAGLEEWHRIYKVLPGREEKVAMIEEYLKRRVSDGTDA